MLPSLSSDGKEDRGQVLKVLVVDTDVKNVRELGVALRQRGWEPLEATSFEQGKRLWVAEQPSMLIADVRLGQFNGLQLLLRARADRPDVVAVITCSFPDKVLEAETKRFGGTFLVKPLAPEQVITVLGSPRAVTTHPTPERRSGDRRQAVMPGFAPDRRMADRRRFGIGR